MITIRKRVYVSENNHDVTFTRLGLDVEKVDTLFTDSELANDITVDTNKRWVGKIERTFGTFEVIKPNTSLLPMRILEGNIYDLYIQGKVSNEGLKNRIEVDFGIGYQALFGLVLICLAPIILMVFLVFEDRWDEINGIVAFLMTFTIPGTLMLIFQLNRTEEEIRNSLGVH